MMTSTKLWMLALVMALMISLNMADNDAEPEAEAEKDKDDKGGVANVQSSMAAVGASAIMVMVAKALGHHQ